MSIRVCASCSQRFDAGRGRANYCSPACRCGTVAGYLAGCRCVDCMAARARRAKHDRCTPKKLVPAIGTARRLRALAALGYDWQSQADEFGVSRDQIRQWAMNTGLTTRTTAARVAAFYDRLSMVPPPTDTIAQRCNVSRARNRAQAAGWAVPLAWDEGTIDDPKARPVRNERSATSAARTEVNDSVIAYILAGEYRLPATTAERREVCRRWHAAGRSLAELGRLTGWKPERYYRLSDQTASAA